MQKCMTSRNCSKCGSVYTPRSGSQKYCEQCGRIVDRERKKEWYKKNFPDAKPKIKHTDPCCVCGGKFSCFYDGKPYCNKHWLRMYNNGTIEPKPRERTCKYEILGDIIRITTKNGDVIIADATDAEEIKKHSWCLSTGGYPIARIGDKNVPLHRFLMDPPEGLVVDHKNGNPLDNRRTNLRVCTMYENSKNQRGNAGRELPVGIRKTRFGRYNARIFHEGLDVYLGNYKTLEEAILERQKAEDKYCGEFSFHLREENNEGAE